MSLATNYERLRDVMDNASRVRSINPSQEIEDALRNFDLDVRRCEDLRQQVLAEHEYNHPGSARFCRSQACKMAAGEW